MAVTYKDIYGFGGSWSEKIYRYKKSTDTETYVNAGNSVFDYFDDDAAVGDYLRIYVRGRDARPFDGIIFYVGTAIAGSGIVITPEYYDYDTGAWETIIDYVDETEQFTNLGEHKFYFDATKQPGMVSVDEIRFRITALDSVTEGGAESTQALKYQADAIVIADYPSDNPANFGDIYNADKANSFELLAPVAPATGLVLTYKVRPTDKLALNISFTLSSDTDAGSGDTVVIHGDDIDGNSLDETVDVSAGAGTYTTVNKFSSVSSIDCNGFSAGTISVSQPQWGVIWHTGNYYKLDKKPNFISTYFNDDNKQVELNAANYMTGNGSPLMYGIDSFITFGYLDNEATKETSLGMQFLVRPGITGYYNFIGWNGTGDIYLYSCYVTSTRYADGLLVISGHSAGNRVWNCMFDNGVAISMMYYLDIFNLNALNTSSIVRRAGPTATVDKITGNGISYGSWFQGAMDGYVKNMYVRNCNYVVFMSGVEGHYCIIVDTDTDNWQVKWDTDNTGSRLYRNNTVNLTVIDKDGNPIPDATVVLKDVDGNEVFNVQTDANGAITEQEITRGYIEYSGVNHTSLDTDLTKDYSPHAVTVSKPGYQSYQEKFTLTQKINWLIALEKVKISVDQEVLI